MTPKQPYPDDDPLGEALANRACEGLYLDPEDEAFLRALDAEGLSEEDSIERLKAYLAQTRKPA